MGSAHTALPIPHPNFDNMRPSTWMPGAKAARARRTMDHMDLTESQAWLARAVRRIPTSAQTFSKSPLSFIQNVSPNFLQRAEGAFCWDVDNNRYIDLICGLGAVILGHADPAVNQAAARQMGSGISFSLPHTLEVELAELLCDLIPCAEMVRFGKNGSDVTSAAVRVARAYTNRDKVARCGYHGWHDWFIGSTSRNLGVPADVSNLTLRFPYNHVDGLHALFTANPGGIACVIMEPVSSELPDSGYLEAVRDLCHRHGALLIFDEIVTGFRIAPGGAQQYFGVTPDLACFGKAMGNGFPISAVVGRADVMRLFEEVFFSGTHGGEAVSLAACRTTITELERRDTYRTLQTVGATLQQGTRDIIQENNLHECIDCPGLPARNGLAFTGPQPQLLRSLFQQEAIQRGLLTHGNHMLTAAHTPQIVEEILSIYHEVFATLADAVIANDVAARLLGPPLQPIVRDL